MNKKIRIMLSVFVAPAGAILLSACGPVEGMDNTPSLDEASDSWHAFGGGFLPEYGLCNNGVDDNGNGLADMADPECHINAGPLRDASRYNFPVGHNFFPDVTKILPGGPGFPGGFRDPVQITRWFRFLTEPDGNVAGIDLINYGVNPEVVPIPEPLPVKILQGTAAFGNNNNVSLRELHRFFLEHGFIPGPAPAPVAIPAPIPADEDPLLTTARKYEPVFYRRTRGIPGGRPGLFYDTGSQGALKPSKTGNPD